MISTIGATTKSSLSIVDDDNLNTSDLEKSDSTKPKNPKSCGCLALWDLERQSLIGQLPNAHRAPIHTVITVHAEAIMITVGADNAVRSWTFDAADGLARQLVERLI